MFLLLTILGHPIWHYRINRLHPKTRMFLYYNRYCLCDWESIGMSLAELVNYQIDVGPYDQHLTPNTEYEIPPTPMERDTEDSSTIKPKLPEEEESVWENEPVDRERNLLRREILERNP